MSVLPLVKYGDPILRKVLDTVKDWKSINNIITESEKVIYYKEQEKLISEGKTKIKLQNGHTINSKNVILLIDKNEISSDEYTTHPQR